MSDKEKQMSDAFYADFQKWKDSDPMIAAYIRSTGHWSTGLHNMLFYFFKKGYDWRSQAMSNQIPPPETAEREAFNNTVIGCLVDGSFYCSTCKPLERQTYPVKVYGINVAPYSAVCHQCSTVVVDGVKKAVDDKTPLCFDE